MSPLEALGTRLLREQRVRGSYAEFRVILDRCLEVSTETKNGDEQSIAIDSRKGSFLIEGRVLSAEQIVSMFFPSMGATLH